MSSWYGRGEGGVSRHACAGDRPANRYDAPIPQNLQGPDDARLAPALARTFSCNGAGMQRSR
ncbi:hypothetical protein BURMUCF1_A1215 [Burkholderia multivorans ATCC BAA-247]|nr:hypothetical protein BURMUCF1_A1215 [Burkholderia multivorans ATCC BAA-247]